MKTIVTAVAALDHYHGSEIQDQEYWRLFADAWTGWSHANPNGAKDNRRMRK